MYYADQNEVHVDILGGGGYVNFHARPLEGGEGVKIG